MIKAQFNIFGGPLRVCGKSPVTGFFRNGCCDSTQLDPGQHTVCVVISQAFLEFSMEKGNDLVSPNAKADFPGLRPGDKWCVCANRWIEAHEAGKAPKVVLSATNQSVLDLIEKEVLIGYGIDPVPE